MHLHMTQIDKGRILTAYTAQKILRDLKSKISSQSKKNFVLEKDVRYLDSRIALLIQNRMALEEVRPAAFRAMLVLY
jgi:Ras GTPase-activating-like protein IQGAP2/3